MRRFIIRLFTLALAFLYATFCLIPTRPRVVCISRQTNQAPEDFLLLRSALAQCKPPYQTIILARQLRNPLAYLPEVVRQVYFIATSQAVVLDSYCIAVGLLNDRIKAPVLQIWHAMGNMKAFGYAGLNTPEGRNPETAELLGMHRGYDAVAISSLSFRDDFARGFGVDPSIIFEAPLPRTDHLTDPNLRAQHKAAFTKAFPQTAGRKTIVYCPTFRKDSSEECVAIKKLLSLIDFNRFNFVFMPHPISKLSLEDPRVITMARGFIDPLLVADIVISDYSTAIYEAGLVGVPVYLYVYDWDTYHAKRGMYINLKRDVPTIVTEDAAVLVDALETEEFDSNAYAAFVARNIALPKEQSCTDLLCSHILRLIKQTEKQ